MTIEQVLQGLALPFVTGELPGTGGSIKQIPEHFIVEEVPLYAAEGSGPHVYVNLTRAGWTTRDVVVKLGQCFDVPVRDIGYAGLKDRQALATQTFSVPGIDPQTAAARISDQLPFQVNWVRPHRNKLRTGHLLGNRFTIFVADVVPGAAARAAAIADRLLDRGLPNFYGPQRFGRNGDNAVQGYQALLGRGPRQQLGHRPSQHWLRDLVVSAFQAALFNLYLVRRWEAALFFTLLQGDVAKKHTTGGLFVVEDPVREQPRFEAREISHTGPMVGSKMMAASGPAGELEAGVLAEVSLPAGAFKKAHVEGSRRLGRLLIEGLSISDAGPHLGERTLQGGEVGPQLGVRTPPEEGSVQLDVQSPMERQTGLWLRFQLPKGAYATNVLREFMKHEVSLADDAQDADSD